MIQAEQIRLGNWFHHTDNWSYRQPKSDYMEFDFKWEQADWHALSESTLNLKDIEPIEITEEWLLKYGFSSKGYKVGNIGIMAKSFHLMLTYPGVHGIWQIYFIWEFDNYKIVPLEYVYQLQNLFYTLIGEELTMKK